MECKVVGFVIGVSPYKDNDAIINLLTKDGKISFKARGILKITSKNAPSCQLFNLGEYILTSKTDNGHKSLINANCIKRVKNIIDKPIIATYLSFFCEIISKVDDNYSDEYYNFFDKLIDYFNNGYNDYLTLTLVTLATLMKHEGISLEANFCVNCANDKNIEAVSYKNGGYICHACNNEKKEPTSSITYLRNFRLVVLASIDDVTKFEVDKDVGIILLSDFFNYLEHYGGINFRFKNILRSVLK